MKLAPEELETAIQQAMDNATPNLRESVGNGIARVIKLLNDEESTGSEEARVTLTLIIGCEGGPWTFESKAQARAGTVDKTELRQSQYDPKQPDLPLTIAKSSGIIEDGDSDD